MHTNFGGKLSLLRSVYISPLTMFVWLFVTGNAHAVHIQKVHFIQAEGNVEFRIEHANKPLAVHWYAVRKSINEDNFESITSSDTLQSVGATAVFALKKHQAEITYYRIVAADGDGCDSIDVQVCKTGVLQKYVYENNPATNKPLPVWIVLPRTFSPNSKFLMAMTGHHRNAEGFARYWTDFANDQDYVIAVPEFNYDDWPLSGYNLGNIFTTQDGSGELNEVDKWSFKIVARIHTELSTFCGLIDSTYQMWGFSGGGQFVHRLAMFIPDPLIVRYIVCSPGWYTLPDLQIPFPYGLKNRQLHYTEADIKAFTELPAILMCGTEDVERDKDFNTEIKADTQGANRFARAQFFYDYLKKVNPGTTWEFVEVPDIAHEASKMAKASGKYIIDHPLK